MFKLDPIELGEFSHLLQNACAQLTADIPDTPAIAVDDKGLTFVSPVWTAAMTRDVLRITMQESSVDAKTRCRYDRTQCRFSCTGC